MSDVQDLVTRVVEGEDPAEVLGDALEEARAKDPRRVRAGRLAARKARNKPKRRRSAEERRKARIYRRKRARMGYDA